jgi:predicted nucleic acid-binding protein
MPRLYLDTCCWNRPFDDQRQDRVRTETEAILAILLRGAARDCVIISSDAVDEETAANPDPERRRRVEVLATVAHEHVPLDPQSLERARSLEAVGFGGDDSLHLACAEAAGSDALLTTDDALVRRARRLQSELNVRVVNPLTWLKENPE